MESTVAVATSPINGKRRAHVAKVRLCRQKENAQKIDADRLNKDVRIVENAKDSEESDISWSDRAFSLHWGGKH